MGNSASRQKAEADSENLVSDQKVSSPSPPAGSPIQEKDECLVSQTDQSESQEAKIDQSDGQTSGVIIPDQSESSEALVNGQSESQDGEVSSVPDQSQGLELATDQSEATKTVQSDDTEDINEVSVDQSESPRADLNDPDSHKAATKIQASYRGFQVRREQKKRHEAATKIQANYRGFQVRKISQHKKQESEADKAPDAEAESKPAKKDAAENQEEIIDIDLNDPEVEQAAVKIQASFKGFQARKGMSKDQEKAPADATAAATDSSSPGTSGADNSAPAPTPAEDTSNNAIPVVANAPEPAQEEEAVDIDLNDPDVEQAAVKIQASFRGFQTRKEVKKSSDEQSAASVESSTGADAEVKDDAASQEAEKEEEIDIDLNDPEVEKAAITIQATFKGFKTRKDMDKKPEDVETEETDQTPAADQSDASADQPAGQSEEIDIDLNDPEVEKAATKIQASFKGFQVRKGLGSKEGSPAGDGAPGEEGVTESQQGEVTADDQSEQVAAAGSSDNTTEEVSSPRQGEGEGQTEEKGEGPSDTPPVNQVEQS